MMRMPPMRFYAANILSALVWAPTLVLLGDELTQLLGHERLATKILYIAVAVGAVLVLAAWLQRRLLSK